MPVAIAAQQPGGQPTQPRTRGIQYQEALDSATMALREKPMKLFEGASVSGDLLGLVMYGIANYGQLEGAVRVNLKGRFFPTLELGIGHSDHKDEETELLFKTNSPYARIGCDYNFAKDVRSGNRVFGGLRFGYTKATFDLSGPDLIDPVWQTAAPFQFKDLESKCSWGELVFGIEAKIWGIFHLGWNVRYRMRLNQKIPSVGQAWYIPGFGKNDTHNFGGTFNLIFDI